MQNIHFYQNHLDQVSRSFAFCIPQLPTPLRQWISLSYLLCRVLDTIEDSTWENRATQKNQYLKFCSFLSSPPQKAETLHWATEFPSTTCLAERKLLADAYFLFQDLNELPQEARNLIQTSIQKMERGMQHYSYRSQESVLRLVDLTDVHRYCYFVAGVVGELLSGLFLIYRPSFRPSSDFQLNGLHFGLFLQKINLLKDQHSDELEKRFLVPDRKALLCSLRKNAQGALNYLLCLPQEESGYRIFCGWSLFLGVASLPWISQAYDAPGEVKNIKIPRSVTQTLLESVQDIAHSNELLKKGFDELLPPFLHEKAPTLKPSPLNSRQSHQSNPEDWFSRLLEGTLGLTEMIQLEMV